MMGASERRNASGPNDPADAMLPSAGPALFTDGAGRRKALDTAEKGGRKAYERLWAENREQLRALLATGGTSNSTRYAPPDAKPLSEEEREELAQLFAGEPSVSDMIIEARRERWD